MPVSEAIFGIGEIGIFEENEAPMIPSAQPRRRQPDYPGGRMLDCGCVVYYKWEVMSASLGSACSECYDRLSDV